MTSEARDRAAAWLDPQRLRLASGLILFAFVLTHFLNHALGIYSVAAMEAVQEWRRGFWRFPPVEAVLVAAAVAHVSLALWKTGRRGTLRMPAAEAAQLGLGLLIPVLIAPHVVSTFGLAHAFGVDDPYRSVLSLIWPGSVLMQAVALLVVWTHAMIGLNFWLSGRAWYRRSKPVLLAAAVALPLLAEWGWIDAARRLWLLGQDTASLTAAEYAWGNGMIEAARWLYVAAALTAAAAVASRILPGLSRRRITITYPGRRSIRVGRGPTLLEISRMHGIPHASVCGGRARCSTCRTRILAGLETLPPADPVERSVLERIGADPSVRLACQIRPAADLAVEPLLPARVPGPATAVPADAYHWGVEKPVAILFVDLRGFTSLSEKRLTYDVVFVLNRYLDAMARAVRAEDGFVDKFIGDAVMAIFGMNDGPRAGARRALAAAVRMARAADELDRELAEHLAAPLRIGIGIHIGPAILGRIGAAGGAGASGITALGDTVNTASRLESLTKDLAATLVVSHAVAHAAGARLAGLAGVREEEVAVRGRQGRLRVYAVDDLAAVASALAEGAAKAAV
jgi:adenylate cyclase